MSLLQVTPPGYPAAQRLAADLAAGYRRVGFEAYGVVPPTGRPAGGLVDPGDWLVAAVRRCRAQVVEVWAPVVSPAGLGRLRREGIGVVVIDHRRSLPGLAGVCHRWMAAAATRVVAAGPGEAVPQRELPVGIDLGWFQPSSPPVARPRLQILARDGSCPPELAVAVLEALLARDVPAELELEAPGPASRLAPLPIRLVPAVTPARIGLADVALEIDPGDTSGRGVLEVLACGTPVVTASVGAGVGLVGPGTGVSVPPGPRGIAAAVLEVAAWDPAARRRACRRLASRHPLTDSLEAMVALYEGLGLRRRAAGSADSGRAGRSTPTPPRRW